MQEIIDNALEPKDWVNHLENDLMKFWNNEDAIIKQKGQQTEYCIKKYNILKLMDNN